MDWIREDFYENKKKKVPFNIGEYLSPLAIAVWIIGDGHFTGHGLLLYTNSFSYEDVFFLRETIIRKFDWKLSIRKKNQYFLLYVHAESLPNVASVVGPFMEHSMKYKLPMN